MSFIALEWFNKQLALNDTITISKLLKSIDDNTFKLSFPSLKGLDYSSSIDKISQAIGNLINVVQTPYIILKSEYETMHVGKVSQLTPEGVRKTTLDPKLWKKKNNEFKPEYAYSKTTEDEYNTYENRFVKALIDRLYLFLNKPFEDSKSGIKSLYESHFNCNLINKIDLIRLAKLDNFKNSDEVCFDNYKKLYYLRMRLIQIKNTNFYKIMSAFPSFSSKDVEATNLLIHHKDYNTCLRLWYFLNEYDTLRSSLSTDEIASTYSMFIFLNIINSLIKDQNFKILKDNVIKYSPSNLLNNVSLENKLFDVNLVQKADSISFNITNKASKENKDIVIKLRVNNDDISAYDYLISLKEVDYSDNALQVTIDNSLSLESLKALLKCIFLTINVTKDIYNHVCLICKSNAIEEKDGKVHCFDCNATYKFLDDGLVWVLNFDSYKNK
ncbi:MAG: DUF2357 domain-containing protein [Candidatus Caccosoma sp.]|nr:DUF2357 domain-containing protein [Candidatus Caccosoma sp.]